VGEERTEGAQQVKQYVTVGEAARLLGVHRNTIHHRIKVGRINAHKVVEGEREVYRIDLDSLGVRRTSVDVRTLDARRPTGEDLAQAMATRLEDIMHTYVRELGDLREQLGGERARRQMAEERVADLKAELEALRAPETAESPGPSPTLPAESGEPETAAEGRSWWSRMFGG